MIKTMAEFVLSILVSDQKNVTFGKGKFFIDKL